MSASTKAGRDGAGGARPSAARWFVRLFLTLRGRLLLLVGFAIVPALLFVFFAASQERQAAVDRIEAEARHLGNLAAREHAHQLNGGRHLVDRLASTVPCAGDPAASACPIWLPVMLGGFPQFANIGVADANGEIVCSAAEIPHPARLAGNDAFTRALSSAGTETGAYTMGLVGRPVLHLARAVRGTDGRACAVVFVAVELGWLDQLARQTNLPADYSLLIADRAGRVLARSGAARDVGEPVPALAPALERPRGAVVELGAPASARYVVATPMDEVPGVFVVAGLPWARVQSAASRAFYRTLAGLLLVGVFGIAAAIVAVEVSIFRVLRGLIGTVRRLAGGDLSARAPLPGSHGELRELAVSFGTMAEALAAREREAVEAQERLRALSSRLQAVRDEEAGRIARELHDELGQVLTGLKLELASARRGAGGARPGADEALRRMSDHVDGAIDTVRRISSELRPPVLDRLGLAAAIDWLARDLEERSGVRVRFHAVCVEEPIDELVATTLFRIVQEALTNVARHASATEVTIDLAGHSDGISLTIRDDGRGFDPAIAEGPHALGILGMRERARIVSGTWRMRGRPGAGTTIEVEVPRRPPVRGAPLAEMA